MTTNLKFNLKMYITIVFLPFLGAIFSGLFGRALGVKGVHIINISCLLITTILAFLAYYEVVLCNSPVSVELFSWINSEHLKISWAFYFDPLTVNMLIPVLIVSLLVHVYSIGYMGEDPHQQRFFSYISLFTGLMLVLVTGNNFLVMFLGWEGVGVCSYLLVHFWYTRVAAVKSALNAMFTNRVGDYFLTLGFFAIFYTFGTLDYATVFSIAPYINTNVITFISILLLLGAAAKSAQIGLHQWLPYAMEGPTPVSSLIHAATMVTAGVYLLVRCSPLLEQSDLALSIIMIAGAVTAFFAASVGLFQNDIKKVIAYSTMSQLGMMVIAVGISQYNIALAHLVLHAMYKAGLFLAAGSVLHALGDQQDFRRFGGLVKILPVTYTVMLIASLSLAALPWLSGYYSKDLIIELAYGSYTSLGYLVYLLATIAACFTMLYSVKLLYLTFLTYANAPKGNYEKAHESPWVMTLPLIILGVLSVYLGNITRDYFMGLGSQGFGNSIFVHPNHIILIDTEFGVPILNKLLPLILSMIFAILALFLFEKKPLWLLRFNISNLGKNIYRFFNQRYWFELIYNKCLVKGTLYIGYVTNTILDRGALELIGPRGAVAGLYKISNYFASFDSGSIARYAFVMFSGLLFMLISWIMFANPESILVDSYISNFINGSTLTYGLSIYTLIIVMSYLNCINNIFYFLFIKNNYIIIYSTNYIVNDNIFYTADGSDLMSGSGSGSGSASGSGSRSAPGGESSNNNSGGSKNRGEGNGNNKRSHEDEDEDEGYGRELWKRFKDNQTKLEADYDKKWEEDQDRELQLAIERSIEDQNEESERKRAKHYHKDETYNGKGKEVDHSFSPDYKGKGKAIDENYGTYQNNYTLGREHHNFHRDESLSTTPNPYEPNTSKAFESKDKSMSYSNDNLLSTGSISPRTGQKYLGRVDALNLEIGLRRSKDEFDKLMRNKGELSSNNNQDRDESLSNDNNEYMKEISNSNNEDIDESISNKNNQDRRELSSKFSTKNKEGNVSKEVAEPLNNIGPKNYGDILPESSSPFLMKDNPVKNILEYLAKIWRSYSSKSSKEYTETSFESGMIDNLFDNTIDDWFNKILTFLPESVLLTIVYHPLLLGIISLVITVLIWIMRFWSYIILFKRYISYKYWKIKHKIKK